VSISKDVQKAIDIGKEFGWDGLWRAFRKRAARHLDSGSFWGKYSEEASIFSTLMDFSSEDLELSLEVQRKNPGRLDIRSITWFLPEFSHPYYGGIHTLLRFADYFSRSKGVRNTFIVLGSMSENQISQRIESSFPDLAGSPVQSISIYNQVESLGPTDAGIASLWGTAYFLLRYNNVKRKFYFVQDYEPLFYPAGSISALAEATYGFGFFGIANTPTIRNIYESKPRGKAAFFLPAIDTSIFYPIAENRSPSGDPLTIFFYGRPKHPRNGFELGAQALRQVKKRMGDRVRIISAGDDWHPRDHNLNGVVENLGLLDYEETADLYRKCTVGLIMMFTQHPSYLPFELMASRCLVVSNRNQATGWVLKDKENCLLSEPSSTWLAETILSGLQDANERERIVENAYRMIRSSFSDWNSQIDRIFQYICDPSVISYE
jgi:glycosyltransferase involved in cell wall biosynthesis